MTPMTQHHRGPAAGFPPPAPQHCLHRHAPARELVLVGAHGGAGTTTLAMLLPPAWDMGALHPGRDARYPALATGRRPLLLVCRTTAAATTAATTAAAALTQPGTVICVLVVVSDGWPEPAAATARLRLLEPRIAAIVRFPFIPALRLAGNPAAAPLPRRARRALHHIRALTGHPAPAR